MDENEKKLDGQSISSHREGRTGEEHNDGENHEHHEEHGRVWGEEKTITIVKTKKPKTRKEGDLLNRDSEKKKVRMEESKDTKGGRNKWAQDENDQPNSRRKK